jgi:hypothetical protein
VGGDVFSRTTHIAKNSQTTFALKLKCSKHKKGKGLSTKCRRQNTFALKLKCNKKKKQGAVDQMSKPKHLRPKTKVQQAQKGKGLSTKCRSQNTFTLKLKCNKHKKARGCRPSIEAKTPSP